jgi:hypothetical protein
MSLVARPGARAAAAFILESQPLPQEQARQAGCAVELAAERERRVEECRIDISAA